jgi:hypothetical protein
VESLYLFIWRSTLQDAKIVSSCRSRNYKVLGLSNVFVSMNQSLWNHLFQIACLRNIVLFMLNILLFKSKNHVSVVFGFLCLDTQSYSRLTMSGRSFPNTMCSFQFETQITFAKKILLSDTHPPT